MIAVIWLMSLARASDLNLTSFSKQMFWQEPPQGLFTVDVGLGNVTNQHLFAFVDLNADKYTDVITVG
jgi:hypothetical protein